MQALQKCDEIVTHIHVWFDSLSYGSQLQKCDEIVTHIHVWFDSLSFGSQLSVSGRNCFKLLEKKKKSVSWCWKIRNRQHALEFTSCGGSDNPFF